MWIIGCDLHTRYQQAAAMNDETGEVAEIPASAPESLQRFKVSEPEGYPLSVASGDSEWRWRAWPNRTQPRNLTDTTTRCRRRKSMQSQARCISTLTRTPLERSEDLQALCPPTLSRGTASSE